MLSAASPNDRRRPLTQVNEEIQTSVAGAPRTGRFSIIEQFLADGIDHMFGNPGTVEQGFLDALAAYPRMKYILTLQESIAVLMADGYARASRGPALVQLHSTPGVGNGIGALYQAKRGHAPLIVIGGDSGIRYQAMQAQMYGDLVAMAEPVTKWATMVQEPANLLRVLRRAIKIALTPPMGPVYVCLPQDVLDAPAEDEVRPTSLISTRTQPETGLIEDAARMLAAARRPIFFVGDGVAFSGAEEELARLALTAGAEVYEVDAGESNMAVENPLYQGMTGHMFGEASLPITTRGDVNLVVGTYMVPEVFPLLGDIYAPGAKVIHVDLDTDAIAKNHRVDLGMLGDPKLTMAALTRSLESSLSDEQRGAVATRVQGIGDDKRRREEAALDQDRQTRDASPLHMSRFAEELSLQLPQDAIVFDEALTNSPPLSRHLAAVRRGSYHLTRGGSLGVGFPGAIGAKIAHPDRVVLGISGDGGAMYTIQALWSAARHHVAVKFIVCNNRSYRLLQANIDQYWASQGLEKHDYPLSFDLSTPPLQFVDIARGLGVAGVRVEQPWEIEAVIREALAHPGPYLIDLVLEGNVHPEMIGVKCGQ